MSLPVVIRAMEPLDTPFVFSSWLRSYRANSDMRVSQSLYYAGHHEVIEGLLKAPGVEVVVASPEGDPNTILGWCCRGQGVVHYVYVKEAFRRMGLAKMLVGEFSQHSHITRYGEWALGKHPSEYNPYLATNRTRRPVSRTFVGDGDG